MRRLDVRRSVLFEAKIIAKRNVSVSRDVVKKKFDMVCRVGL